MSDKTLCIERRRVPGLPRNKGLFATESIPKGSIVAYMTIDRLRTIKQEDWEDTYQRERIKDDGMVESGNMCYTDFLPRGSPPKWYYINHSHHPSAEPQTVKINGMTTIGWVTLRQLEENDQVTMKYVNPDPNWQIF